jgi:hypothetical protein
MFFIAMLFNSTKAGHFAHILSSGFLGNFLVNQLTPPTPDQIQAWGSMIIQFLVAVVTIWATIRKALQKPQPVVSEPGSPVTSPPVSATSATATDITVK